MEQKHMLPFKLSIPFLFKMYIQIYFFMTIMVLNMFKEDKPCLSIYKTLVNH